MLSRWFAAFAALVMPGLAGAQAPASWSGFYLGPELGGARGHMRVSGTDRVFQLTNEHPAPPGSPNNPLIIVPSRTSSYAGSGNNLDFLYGGFGGGQIQTGNLVFGVEADAHGGRDAANVSVDVAIPAHALAPTSDLIQSRDLRIDYDWSLRGRVGIATGRTLFYATGGVAQARVRLTGQDSFFTPAGPATSNPPPEPTFQSPTIGPVVTTFSANARMTGWTAGLGGEQRIGRHFGIGLDARYADYGSHTIAFNCDFQSARTGVCGSYTTPPIVIYGRTHDATDTTPGGEPGPTRVSLSEWRLAARLIFRF